MKMLPGSVVLVAAALALSACGSSHRAGGPTSHPQGSVLSSHPLPSVVSAKTISSSRLILDGRVRCTATVSRSVQAGSPLGLTFAVRNVTSHPVKTVLPTLSWFVVRSKDGTTYDSRVAQRNPIGGPAYAPVPIPAGATKKVGAFGSVLRVRWSGPLRVTPGCGQTALPPLSVGVTSPGPPTDDGSAIADVVAAAGHLLDRCSPQSPGVAVEGQIDPPNGNAPPMRATCSVSLHRQDGFLVAQALVVIGVGPRDVRIQEPYERLSFPNLLRRPYEVIGWQFVVTKDGATGVSGSEADATKPANHMAPDWNWTGSEWQGPGGSRCGGSGTGGGYAGPLVEFISVCPG